ncbi:zinc finger BED domain-containing protein isoform X3 [Sardina pilchardus]|uniref:zinc finger BED domain-containing protein isoform X3 n=1 Tax=Sardina pilchardus TaxID=27697 RepID=UPI002E15EDE9
MATRKRSIVWSFFKEEDSKKVVCLICTRTIHHFGKTTNMLRHLRSEHPGEFSDFNFESIVTGLTAKTASNTKNNLSNGLVEVAVMLGKPESAPQLNGIEDMEVHGVIEGILCASAGQGPSSDQNSELDNADEVTGATPSRKRSAVWMHYQKVDDEKKALCLLCKEKIQHQSSTSNLLRHLRKKHPSHFSQLEMSCLQHAGGQKIYHMNTPQASTDFIANCHTDSHQSNHTGTAVSSAVRRPNHQLNAAVMLGSPESASQENGIEDMEVHGAIQGILRAAAGQGPNGDQNSNTADVEGVTVATTSRKCSAVWTHYQKIDDEKRALCLLCKKKIQHHSSTSNLLRHLQKKHPSHFSQLEVHSLKHTGGRKTQTDIQRSSHTNAPSLAVSSPNCQDQHLQSTCHSSSSCPGLSESRVLQRERELTEALRRVQREEGQCLQQQRELLEKSRELQAETHALQTERYALQEEAKVLQKEKEEIQAEREKLQNERKEVERLKQELKEEQAMLLGQRPEANLMCDL